MNDAIFLTEIHLLPGYEATSQQQFWFQKLSTLNSAVWTQCMGKRNWGINLVNWSSIEGRADTRPLGLCMKPHCMIATTFRHDKHLSKLSKLWVLSGMIKVWLHGWAVEMYRDAAKDWLAHIPFYSLSVTSFLKVLKVSFQDISGSVQFGMACPHSGCTALSTAF